MSFCFQQKNVLGCSFWDIEKCFLHLVSFPPSVFNHLFHSLFLFFFPFSQTMVYDGDTSLSLISLKKGDIDILTKFYNEIILPTFGGCAEHMDSLDSWLELFLYPTVGYKFHVDLLVDKEGRIGGGSVYEFYSGSLCGLLSYIVLLDEFQGKGYAGKLMKKMDVTLADDAVEHTKGKEGLKATFIETHLPPSNYLYENPPPDSDGGHTETIEEWKNRMGFFQRYSFNVVDAPYLQPPLGQGMAPAFNLLLLARTPDNTLPSTILSDFLVEFSDSCGNEGTDLEDYDELLSIVRKKEFVALLETKSYVEGILLKRVPCWYGKLQEMKTNYLARSQQK